MIVMLSMLLTPDSSTRESFGQQVMIHQVRNVRRELAVVSQDVVPAGTRLIGGSDFPANRSLNRKRRIAFYHLLLEIRTFVLAPELCSVSNAIENRSAIRLVLANDGTRQADEVRLQPVRCCVHYRIPMAAHVHKRQVR